MVKIQWSALAGKQLKEIYNYYKLNAAHGTAKRITNKIINHVEIHQKQPISGQKEELLKDYPEEFRYLVVSNYKLIY